MAMVVGQDPVVGGRSPASGFFNSLDWHFCPMGPGLLAQLLWVEDDHVEIWVSDVDDSGNVTQRATLTSSYTRFGEDGMLVQTDENRCVLVDPQFDLLYGYSFDPGTNTITETVGSYTASVAVSDQECVWVSRYDADAGWAVGVAAVDSGSTPNAVFIRVQWRQGDSVPVVLSEAKYSRLDAFSTSNSRAGMAIDVNVSGSSYYIAATDDLTGKEVVLTVDETGTETAARINLSDLGAVGVNGSYRSGEYTYTYNIGGGLYRFESYIFATDTTAVIDDVDDYNPRTQSPRYHNVISEPNDDEVVRVYSYLPDHTEKTLVYSYSDPGNSWTDSLAYAMSHDPIVTATKWWYVYSYLDFQQDLPTVYFLIGEDIPVTGFTFLRFKQRDDALGLRRSGRAGGAGPTSQQFNPLRIKGGNTYS